MLSFLPVRVKKPGQAAKYCLSNYSAEASTILYVQLQFPFFWQVFIRLQAPQAFFLFRTCFQLSEFHYSHSVKIKIDWLWDKWNVKAIQICWNVVGGKYDDDDDSVTDDTVERRSAGGEEE